MLKFHKEGSKIILIATFLATVIIIGCDYLIHIAWIKMLVQLVTLFFLVIVLQFFRNPNRELIVDDNVIFAPVDGKVVVIEEVFESEYFVDKRLQVSIFMSPINVHVTRYCCSGRINFSKYHPGKFLVAWHPKSSEENERTTIVIKNETFGEILYRQIAGALARRIVNYAVEGQMVVQGEDAGFIKFGSRVDLFFPIGTKINVKLGEKAIGNRTIIATKS